MSGKILLVFFLGLCAVGKSEPTFRYVTSYNKEGRLLKSQDLEKTTVNILKPIIFLINGSDKPSNDSWYKKLMEAYLNRQVHNVFIVDSSSSDSETSASSITDFVKTLYNKTGESLLDFHLVGVLEGAEIATKAAQQLSASAGKKIQRITALEPSTLLSKREGVAFVDVVHSLEVVKDIRQEGDVTFYLDCKETKDFGASEVFAKSINSGKFKGVKCDSLEDLKTGKCEKNDKVTFGENVDKTVRGSFFVTAC